MRAQVQAVVINWRRPQNLPSICRALREQSVPVEVVIVDCSPSPEHALPAEAASLADEVFRWREDLGPSSRFVAGYMRHRCEYTYYHDDDAIPGRRVVEHYLRTASDLGDRFSVLGQQGRRVQLPEGRYQRRKIERQADAVVPVDTTVRFHFVRTEHHTALLALKWKLMRTLGDVGALSEDDLLLNLGIQMQTGHPTLLTPYDNDSETLSELHILPEPHSRRSRAVHHDDRTTFVQAALSIGWHRTWHKASTDQPNTLERSPWSRILRRKRVTGNVG